MDPRRVSVAYDRHADVLHVTLGDAVPYEGDGRPKGVELDYALKDGSPCGAKVIGFERNGWTEKGRLAELASILGRHLSVPAAEVALAVARAIGR
jgi:hypothetical protein